MPKYIKKVLFYGMLIGLSGFYSSAMADEDRHLPVDREIGGMESHIGAPKSTPNRIVDTHKTIGSSQGTRKAAPSSAQPASPGGNHGNIYTGTGVNNDTGGNTGDNGESSTDSGDTQAETEPPQEATAPIVDADVSINPESGAVDVDAAIDTTGELEEKQIFETDLEAEGISSVDADVTSAADITGEEVVQDADITTSGQTSDSTQVTAGETAQEPTPDSTQESSQPIVDADTNVNPESGAIEADATVDTSGEIEERQIIDADVAVGETTAETEVGSATDITQSETVESADITTEPVSTVTPTSPVTAEIDTTGESTGAEADVGIEADVSGMSEGEDVTCDPADGLLSSSTCTDLKL